MTSAEFVCYSRGGNAIQGQAEQTSEKGYKIYPRGSGNGNGNGDSVNISCCNSGCVVM